jgi:ABC-2 type transport system ATP-binding protein
MIENTPYVINTSNLTKHFGEIHALNGIDLKVPKNSIFGFLGPNGAGKTTAIKLLLGLQKPTSGNAKIFNQDMVEDSLNIRQKTGYLAQDPNYHDHMTARQILDFRARFYYKGPKDEIQNRVAESIELVNLEDKADRPIKGFSEGEKQRLGIAQAQINHPDLLILDEPASSLDPMGRRDVLEIMKDLRKHSTVFYSTHILDDVQRVSTHVAILKMGHLVTQAPIDELLTGGDELLFYVTIKGDPSEAYELVQSQDWVTGVNIQKSEAEPTLMVKVNDTEAAESELLKLIVNKTDTKISKYGKGEHELEEIFMDMVEVPQ